ncbi:MAG TPA: hypothetical protein P5026_05485 [Kiritimatiellia bacterium]|nr:hypothetical protein [Kiritimatiellia bacterium]
MNTITPRDAAESATLSAGKRISAAIGIIISTALTLCGALGGFAWIADNLPLLGVGLGSLVSGGVASYVAVRRMRIDRAAKCAGLVIIALVLAGCVAIRADSTGDGASVWAFGWGADSTAQLSGVAVTGPSTNDSTGVSFDAANSQQQTAQAIQSLVALGAALAPMMAGVPATADITQTTPGATQASADAAPAEAAQTVYSADGYGGSPGPAGEGVYGRPSCARCRAYRAAHPETALINIDDASNRADMWAAVRLRGHTGSSVSLPVLITADGFSQAAK